LLDGEDGNDGSKLLDICGYGSMFLTLGLITSIVKFVVEFGNWNIRQSSAFGSVGNFIYYQSGDGEFMVAILAVWQRCINLLSGKFLASLEDCHREDT
jgi:hypothetical protein